MSAALLEDSFNELRVHHAQSHDTLKNMGKLHGSTLKQPS